MELREIVTPVPVLQSPRWPFRALTPAEGLLETLRDCLDGWRYPADRPVLVRVRLAPEHAHLLPTTRAGRRQLTMLLRRAGAIAGSRVELTEDRNHARRI